MSINEPEYSILTVQEAEKELGKNFRQAEELLKDEDKIERFLQRLEMKLKKLGVIGDKLSDVPLLISLVRLYIKGDYRDIPIGSIIAIVSALIYFLSPIDFVPDAIPGVGYIDDAAVIAVCLKLVDMDVQEYKIWRTNNNRVLTLTD